MRVNLSKSRLATAALVLVAVTATSGCGWFRKENKLYAKDAMSRPLEVPPDLDLPRTDAAVSVPGAPAAPAAAAAAANGFAVQGSREEVFARVGDALAGIEGLTVASSAQALGVYDVSYEGSNFLVRVSDNSAGTFVSVVDARGLPATGEGPGKVVASLKAALAN